MEQISTGPLSEGFNEKRAILILAAIAALLTAVAAAPSGESDAVSTGSCGPDAYYVLGDDGTLTVVGTGEVTSIPYTTKSLINELVIAEGITTIGIEAFEECASLASVSIPSSVTHIGDWSFFGCSSLASVSIPSSVTHIGDWSFACCTSLASVSIPSSVTHIGEAAFSVCESLDRFSGDYGGIADGVMLLSGSELVSCAAGPEVTSVTIPGLVTSIGNLAFEGCSSLASVSIPDSVEYIGYEAFCYCTSLKSVSIPSSATHINQNTFYGCASLASVSIPSSVTHIGYWAFEECSSLKSVSIPDSVTHIGNNAFYGCIALTSIKIPDSVTHIGDWSFAGCTSLASVSIPDSVTHIGKAAFSGCESLDRFSGDYGGIADGVMLLSGSELVSCAAGPGVTSVTIPEQVIRIGNWSFLKCTSLASVSIPSSVTHIGDYAFYYCTSLESVYIPSSVTYIGGWAFRGLTFLDASGGVLDHTADALGGRLFQGSSGTLREVVPENGDRFSSSGLVYEITSLDPLQASLVGHEGEVLSLAVPETAFYAGKVFRVASVGEKAFYGCRSLASVDLGSVSEVGLKAFANCSGLETLIVPNTVKVIGGYAFYGCGITSLDIPGDDVVLERSAFSECRSMEEITFSGHGAVIGQNAFYKNSGVRSVDLSTVASVGTKAFPYCYGLETLVIPGSLPYVGAYAFYKCASLKTLVVEDGVRKILPSAFSECTGLELVYLPASLIYVGENAFYGSRLVDDRGNAIEPVVENLRGNTFYKYGGALHVSAYHPEMFGEEGILYEILSIPDCRVYAIGCYGAIESISSSVSHGGVDYAVAGIGDGAFLRCKTVTSADLSNVRVLGFKALGNCTSIESITFGKGLFSIGAYALYGLSFYDGDGKLPVTPEALRGHTFAGAGGKLHLIDDASETLHTVTLTVSILDGRLYMDGKDMGPRIDVKVQDKQVVTLKAVPDAGYALAGWYEGGDIVTIGTEYRLQMEGDVSLVVKTQPAP